jgi:hypothetical protein
MRFRPEICGGEKVPEKRFPLKIVFRSAEPIKIWAKLTEEKKNSSRTFGCPKNVFK